MRNVNMKLIPYFVSALSGIVVWIGIGIIIGNIEAWDNPLYWKAGIPCLALVTFIIGFVQPKAPSIAPCRWGITQGLSQSVVILLQGLYFGYSMTQYPLSIPVNIILSIPSIASAYLGMALGNFIRRQQAEKQL
jgi:hypothetical protein